MDEEVPPHVITEANPSRPAIRHTSPSTDQALLELSYRFDLHSIHSYRSNNCLDAASHSPKFHPSKPLRRTRSHEDFLHHVRKERQFTSRHQCKPAHLSRIAAVVKEILEDEKWSHPGFKSPRSGEEPTAKSSATHESLTGTSPANCNATTPTTFDYPALSNDDPEDEEDPTELVIRRGAYKVARDARYTPAEDGIKRPGVVKKKIKMRKRKPK